MKPAVALEPRTAFDASPRLGWTVIAAKLRANRNRLAVTRRKSPILTSLQFGFAVPGTVAFTALMTVAIASAFSTLRDEALATTLLASLITMGTIGAFIGSSTTALQALYLSDDVPFLLTLPIPLRILFTSKFAEAAMGAAPPSLLVLAGTFGYGLTRSDEPVFWLIAPLILLSTIVIATSVAIIIVSVVTRFIPPKRARIFLFGISMTVIAVTIFGWRLLAPRPDMLGTVVERNEYAPLWNAVAWTPAGWGAQALSDTAHGRWIPGLALAGLHVAAAVVMLFFASAVFQRTFIHGLNRTTGVQTSLPNETMASLFERAAAVFPQRFGAMVLREWLSLTRDLRRLTGAMWPLGMVFVYTIVLGRDSGTTYGSARLDFWSHNGSLALLPWGLSLGISVYAYGSEGRNVHLLRSLPTRGSGVYLSKAISSMAPVALVSLGAAATSLWFRQAPLTPSLEMLAVIAGMVFGFVLIDTSAAALASNYEAPNIQRTITLTGRLFSFLVGGAFGLALLTAVGRLVLFDAGVPDRWSPIVHAEIGGIQPLGWPLVVIAAATAVGAVGFSAFLAIQQTNHLIQGDH